MNFLNEKIVILSGGRATRLYPVTEDFPKALLDISGKPFIVRQIELLRKNSINNIVICAGFLGEKIKEFIQGGEKFGVNVEYSFDGDELLGTGGAVKKALSGLSDIFFVIYGDSYLNIDYQKILNYFKHSDKSGLMTVFKNQDKWDSSNVVFENNEILFYDKKLKNEKMHFIDYGLGIFKKEIFEREFERKNKFDLEEVYKKLIDLNQLAGFEVDRRFYEIGSFEGLEETRKYFLKLNGNDERIH